MELKTHHRIDDDNIRFATLVGPSTDATNDEELYKAVYAHGRATIREYVKGGFTLGPPTTLTPLEFEQKWRGD
jgi:hypothetical protein